MSFWIISWDLVHSIGPWFADVFSFLQSLRHSSYYKLHILHVPDTYYCNHCSAMAECTLTHWPTDFCDRCSCRSSRSCCARSFARRRKRPWKIFQIEKRSEWVKKTKRFEQMQLQVRLTCWVVFNTCYNVHKILCYSIIQYHSITASPCISQWVTCFIQQVPCECRGVFASEAAKTSKGSAACAQRVLTVGKKIEKHIWKLILKHWRVYRTSLPNGMQIAHARAHKELKWSFITYVQVLTFHPLFYSFLEVNTSFDIDWFHHLGFGFHTVAQAIPQWSQILMVSFRTAALLRQSFPRKDFWPKPLELFPRAAFAFLWPVTPSSWSSCTSFWSELRRCKPAEVNKVKACWCWQAVFVSTKEFRWPCLWMFLNLCQDLQHIVLGRQSLSFVEHFELHVYTENHLSKIMNMV